jgi:hypothetical protein
MQDFAQKQTPEVVISTTEKFYDQHQPKIDDVFIIVKQIFMFFFGLLNVYIQGFYNGYIVMSKELEIFPFHSFIFSQLPLSIQTQISNIQSEKDEYESFGNDKLAQIRYQHEISTVKKILEKKYKKKEEKKKI